MLLARRWIATTIVATLLGGVSLTMAATAFAVAPDAAPPWQPPGSANTQADANNVGTIGFFDASGTQITTGPLTGPMAAYEQATFPTTVGGAKATLFAYAPTNGNQGTFSGQAQTSSTSFGSSVTYPGSLAGSTKPIVTESSTDTSLGDFTATFPNTTGGAYGNTYELRIKTSGTGNGAGNSGTRYASADVSVDTAAGTWTQTFGTAAPVTSAPTATTTTIAATPASTAAVGTTVTLTSTTTAGAAGTVQFTDNGASLGTPVTVDGAGSASYPYTPAVGAHSYVATFVPTTPTAFSGSASSSLSYIVTQDSTSVFLSSPQSGTVTPGTVVTLSAATTPNTLAGSVVFSDNGTALGAAVPVTNGAASTTDTPALGSQSYSAVFTPTDTTNNSTSTSNTLPLTVAATPTSVTLDANPTTVAAGQSTTLTAGPMTGGAGQLVFSDNGTAVPGGTVAYDGTTTPTFVVTPAPGSNSYTVTYTPTNEQFAPSTSTAATVTATQTPTTVGLTASATGQVTSGTPVTLTATPTGDVPGQVVFLDGGQPITGGTFAYTGTGNPTLTYTPSAGGHTFTVTFTPTNDDYASSTSAPISLAEGSIATTVVLASTPTGTVTLGSPVTLTATASPGVPGTVTFFSGTNGLVSVPVSTTGTASTVINPGVGSYSFVAVFTPTDATTYAGATSAPTGLLVTPSQSVLTVKVLTAKPVYGKKPLLQVAVTAPGAIPTGVVTVTSAGKVIAFGVLANGSTIFTLPGNLTPGTKSLVVVYAGDRNVLPATTPLSIKVAKAASTTSVRPRAGSITPDRRLTVTVFVRVSGFVPNGKVSIVINHKTVATGTYRHGYVNITLPELRVGRYSYYARYAGNVDTAGSSSSSHLLIVD